MPIGYDKLSMKDYKDKKIRLVAGLTDLIGAIAFAFFRRPKISDQTVRKIAIMKFDRIGDAFLCLPTLAAVREMFPRAELAFFCAKWNKEVLEGNPAIDRLEVIDDLPDVHNAGVTSFIKSDKVRVIAGKLKGFAPDMAIDLQGSPMNVLAAYRAGVRLRVGFGRKILSFLLTHKAHYDDLAPQAEIYFSLAQAIGYDGPMGEPMIAYGTENVAKVDGLLLENDLRDFIVFHIGAGRSYRQWPIASFAALADRILEKYDVKIVVIGYGADQVLLDAFMADVRNGDQIVSLVGSLDLHDLYYFLSKARFFIGNESSPGHLAASLGLPIVSFMNGWIDVRRWKVQSDKAAVLSEKVHDCHGPACTEIPCPNMAAIAVGEAFKAFQKLYENTPSQ